MRTIVHHASQNPTVAVNQAIIASADIAREAQHHAGRSPKEAWQAATRALIVRELLLQRARALGLVADPRSEDGLRETHEAALIRQLLEAEVSLPTADEVACHRYYLANQARFRSPDLFEPSHILFKAPRDDAPAYTRAMARATAALQLLHGTPGCFESLARALSDCPSSEAGGRLGQVARGDTTPEFEAALWSMQPGSLCAEPVCTRYGVHVVRLDRKVSGEVLPFAQVKERIVQYLEGSVWRRAMAQYVAVLAGRADITGFDMAGAPTPLLQ